MRYSFTSRIRYSETDKDTRLTFPAMMDYFQDTSTFHGEDNGLPLEELYRGSIAWVLSGWQVRIFKTLGLNDIATFTTWAYSFRGSIGLRNYTMSDRNGTLCALADTQYVLMNVDKQLPERIPRQLADGYTIEPDSHMDTGLSRKIRIIKEETALEPFDVMEYMIDTNNHVNNSQYIKTAISFIPKDMRYNCFRAEYKKQARLGNTFYPFRSELENGVQIKFYNEEHDPYFIAEWTFDPLQTGEKYASGR
jgi:medium-chain acyl-[acyl-carrier-protein] hydrolase